MIIYRLATEKYKDDLSGTGSKIFGGRWNSKGTAAVYSTENISLAVLEILVRVDKNIIPPSYHLIRLEIPDQLTVTTIQLNKLKKDWKDDLDYTQWMGTEFIRSQKSILLKIPSAIVEEEHNYIINPSHPDFKKVKIKASAKFRFDDRLFIIK